LGTKEGINKERVLTKEGMLRKEGKIQLMKDAIEGRTLLKEGHH
jgi:hypothetical protein